MRRARLRPEKLPKAAQSCTHPLRSGKSTGPAPSRREEAQPGAQARWRTALLIQELPLASYSRRILEGLSFQRERKEERAAMRRIGLGWSLSRNSVEARRGVSPGF